MPVDNRRDPPLVDIRAELEPARNLYVQGSLADCLIQLVLSARLASLSSPRQTR